MDIASLLQRPDIDEIRRKMQVVEEHRRANIIFPERARREFALRVLAVYNAKRVRATIACCGSVMGMTPERPPRLLISEGLV